jgi:Holliday junction resolvase RusA-like endonuclease
MFDSVSFVILGRVRGQGRPRFGRLKNGQPIAFTDSKTRNDAAMIRTFASNAMVGRKLLEGPLKIVVKVFQQPPKSWSKKKRAAAVWVTGRFDGSNQLKQIEDSLNGIVYADDSQISIIQFERLYVDTPEHVDVTVTRLESEFTAHKVHQQELEPA